MKKEEGQLASKNTGPFHRLEVPHQLQKFNVFIKSWSFIAVFTTACQIWGVDAIPRHINPIISRSAVLHVYLYWLSAAISVYHSSSEDNIRSASKNKPHFNTLRTGDADFRF